ncbi:MULTISPECIES: YlbF family regulator [Vagococcus]|uniref:ComK regulator n=1 Tax=Vagococcus fluvialis bH819 TaxID=1255619 RepID=A0A1X6WNV9_9ENTE|nr:MULTISPECIES: YlbF family regulator [Vagococcus]SLM85960.1 ComK regulator [Vagococcus fluvialis bH819]HCM88327.1 YlbF family regulator [Vagococcus sp.]
MIYNEDFFEIENLVNELSDELLSSQLVSEYVSVYLEMDQNKEVDTILVDFLKAKEAFELIEPYGKYAPDFKEKRRNVRQHKRILDTNELVSNFKFKETSLQNMLDYVTFDIAKSISEDIKIDAGNPFFEFAKRGCGGSCHVS